MSKQKYFKMRNREVHFYILTRQKLRVVSSIVLTLIVTCFVSG